MYPVFALKIVGGHFFSAVNVCALLSNNLVNRTLHKEILRIIFLVLSVHGFDCCLTAITFLPGRRLSLEQEKAWRSGIVLHCEHTSLTCMKGFAIQEKEVSKFLSGGNTVRALRVIEDIRSLTPVLMLEVWIREIRCIFVIYQMNHSKEAHVSLLVSSIQTVPIARGKHMRLYLRCRLLLRMLKTRDRSFVHFSSVGGRVDLSRTVTRLATLAVSHSYNRMMLAKKKHSNCFQRQTN